MAVDEGTIMLQATQRPLAAEFELAMFDLDGVVYVGGTAVPHAAAAIASARELGLRSAFVTNNASRSPEVVASHLVSIGVPALVSEVVTSAQAAARVTVERFGPSARAALLGGDGLREAARAEGIASVGLDEEPDLLMTGYGPDVLWRDIMRAAVLVRDGLPWVASNTDASIPTPYGVAPGHGVLVDTIARFAGVEPVVAGKPAPPLLVETMRRNGTRSALMVGDRLDTDIAGGRAVEVPTLLVLTGVTGLAELVAASPQERPTYLSTDLRGLLAAHPPVDVTVDGVVCGTWTALVVDGRLTIEGGGMADDWWRAAALASWRHLDATGTAVDVSGLVPPVPATGGSLIP